MINFKEIVKKLVGYGAVAVGFLGTVGHALAQTPAYTMDATVKTSVTDLLESLVSGYFGIIPIALGIVGGLMVTLFLVGKLIGWVRGNMHG
jgi:hypothetical protein